MQGPASIVKLHLEAEATSREQAIAWARKALAQLEACGGPDFCTGSTTGNASVKVTHKEP